MTTVALPRIGLTESIELSGLPTLEGSRFREEVILGIRQGRKLIAFFGVPTSVGATPLYAVLADELNRTLLPLRTSVNESYPAISSECSCAHWFEREIAEQCAVIPEGHPWLKPIRFHPSYVPGRDAWGRQTEEILPSVTNFLSVEGEQAHEVAVGPVHAGIIEPGHFRFQCHGEHVFHLEISLGYQHRGVERALIGAPNKRTLHYIETLAGDTSIGHAMAHGQLVETFGGIAITPRAGRLRAVALELERLANHTGDLGALAGDVAYLPTASYCGRLRGDFLNLTALICGNRFGRGLVVPGGVKHDVNDALIAEMLKRLDAAESDVRQAVSLLWKAPSVTSRFEGTGTVSKEIALELGLVGPAGRSSGLTSDVRADFPTEPYQANRITVTTRESGDVFARAFVRWFEIKHSIKFVRDTLKSLPPGETLVAVPALPKGALAVSLVEGWRGRICHVAITNQEGGFAHYKVVDPSFHNWIGLAMALRDQEISDFPLCNKSFNLSYCGHDL